MKKTLRNDLKEKFDENKYGPDPLKIKDVISYASFNSNNNSLKKSRSESDIHEYFHLIHPQTEFIPYIDTKSPYFILNSKYQCCQCTNNINIIDYKLTITCPLCFGVYHPYLRNFIIK